MAAEKETDEALLTRWRDGDEAAGSELLGRNFGLLYRFFQNKVGPDSEDLIQQTFLSCVQHRDSFRGEASFRTFLIRIARNKLIDHIKKRGRAGYQADLGVTSVVDLGMGASNLMVEAEEQRIVVMALRHLPIEHQTALELHYWEEMRAQDIADILEQPLGTVKSRLRLAKKFLREKVDELTAGGKPIPNLEDTMQRTSSLVRKQKLG